MFQMGMEQTAYKRNELSVQAYPDQVPLGVSEEMMSWIRVHPVSVVSKGTAMYQVSHEWLLIWLRICQICVLRGALWRVLLCLLVSKELLDDAPLLSVGFGLEKPAIVSDVLVANVLFHLCLSSCIR